MKKKNVSPNQVRELIVDAYGCSLEHLNSSEALEKIARKSVAAVGATVAEAARYLFQPHGLTLCLILKESHLVISTWPEYQMAVVNIFLCNDTMDAKKCWEVIREFLAPTHEVLHEVRHEISNKPAARISA